VHWGDPAALGVADLGRPDFGDAVTVAPGEVPVFWACGVRFWVDVPCVGSVLTATGAARRPALSEVGQTFRPGPERSRSTQVTPQSALAAARLPLAITHAPGHMLVLDLRDADLLDESGDLGNGRPLGAGETACPTS